MSHLFREYAPFKRNRRAHRGVRFMETGTSTAYALTIFRRAGNCLLARRKKIYTGMIVGENARPEEFAGEPCKAKHLTNMRSQGEGKGIQWRRR